MFTIGFTVVGILVLTGMILFPEVQQIRTSRKIRKILRENERDNQRWLSGRHWEPPVTPIIE